MGLRTDAGRLTSEGAAFTDLLRAGGMLPRGGNDVVALELAARLREWTGSTVNLSDCSKLPGRGLHSSPARARLSWPRGPTPFPAAECAEAKSHWPRE